MQSPSSPLPSNSYSSLPCLQTLECDEISTTSTASQQIIDSMQSEKERRKAKTGKIRRNSPTTTTTTSANDTTALGKGVSSVAHTAASLLASLLPQRDDGSINEEGQERGKAITSNTNTTTPNTNKKASTHSKNSKKSKNSKQKSRQESLESAATNNTSRSIMTIKTLEESLRTTEKDGRWKKVVDNKRRRRRLKTRVDGVLKEVKKSQTAGNGTGTPLSSATSTQYSSGSSSVSDIGMDLSLSSRSLNTNGSNLSTSKVSTEKFDVRYDHVMIREYEMIPGDNPSVTTGPPVTINWTHNTECKVDLETYEAFRSESDRRLQTQMKMPPSIRTNILLQHGYSKKNIREVTKEAAVIRRQRIRSIETLHKDKMDEKFELMKRVLYKPFKSKKQKDEERAMKGFYSSKDDLYDYGNDRQESGLELESTKRAMNRERVVGFLEGGEKLRRVSDSDLTRYTRNENAC